MNILLNLIIIFLVLYLSFKFHVLAGLCAVVVLGIIGYISNYPRLMTGRANAEFLKKNYDKAFEYYKKAHKSSFRKYNVDISYAQALLRVGRPEEAFEILNKIMSLPLTPAIRKPATMVRCMIKYKLGQINEAYEDAIELFEDGYKTSNMYSIIGLFMHEKNEEKEKILDFCLKAYEYDTDNRDVVDNLVLAYIKNGDFENAIMLGKDLTQKCPSFIEGWYHLAQAYLLSGSKEDAKTAFKNISSCERSYLTTVTKEEIDSLYTQIM